MTQKHSHKHCKRNKISKWNKNTVNAGGVNKIKNATEICFKFLMALHGKRKKKGNLNKLLKYENFLFSIILLNKMATIASNTFIVFF